MVANYHLKLEFKISYECRNTKLGIKKLPLEREKCRRWPSFKNSVQGVDMGSENSGFYIDVIVAIENIKVQKGY